MPPPLAITTCRKTSQPLRAAGDALLNWPHFPQLHLTYVGLTVNYYLEAYTMLQPYTGQQLTKPYLLSLPVLFVEDLFTLQKTIQVSINGGQLSKLYHTLTMKYCIAAKKYLTVLKLT